MILYRCGHFSDNNLSKGNYWSNFITENLIEENTPFADDDDEE